MTTSSGPQTAPRIAALNPPYDPDVDAALKAMMPQNSPVPPLALFRTLAKNLELSRRITTLGGYLLRGRDAALPQATRELVILRVCAQCQCAYEWGVHAASYAEKIGLSDAQLAATWHGSPDDPVWSAEQRAVLRLVDTLHQSASVSDEIWATLGPDWTDAQMLELLVLVGWYHAISFVANGARVPPEPWAPHPSTRPSAD